MILWHKYTLARWGFYESTNSRFCRVTPPSREGSRAKCPPDILLEYSARVSLRGGSHRWYKCIPSGCRLHGRLRRNLCPLSLSCGRQGPEGRPASPDRRNGTRFRAEQEGAVRTRTRCYRACVPYRRGSRATDTEARNIHLQSTLNVCFFFWVLPK